MLQSYNIHKTTISNLEQKIDEQPSTLDCSAFHISYQSYTSSLPHSPRVYWPLRTSACPLKPVYWLIYYLMTHELMSLNSEQ